MGKTAVLEAIGETNLSRADQIAAALGANDRIKYYFSLLQTAFARADRPDQPADSLRRERLAGGIDDDALDNLVGNSRRENSRYRIPGSAAVLDRIIQDLRIMAAPCADFAERLERVLGKLPRAQDDWMDRGMLDDLTRAGKGGADSPHQLVMDLHKALNAIEAELAEERLDGAAVYRIQDSDRPIVAAFMAGLNRTAPLKFNHPGLGTTATRDGNRLIIQNDLGTTDAHVIVIHVEAMSVQVTYTDIHPERIQFLRHMLKPYAVAWGDEQSVPTDSAVSENAFQLVTARFDARDSTELAAYLNFFASRLVFLIDWNRARKELRGFLRGKDRIALLGRAAEANVGHRAFLELGGAQLINRAIEDTAGSAMHFGDRLCDVLGDQAAMDFLRFVFRTAMEGLRDHQSTGLVQDRIRAELQAHFSSEGKRLLGLASEQAAIIFEIASLVRDGIHGMDAGYDQEDDKALYERLAKRAREFEHTADQLVAAAREAVRKRPEYATLFSLLENADNAADELEEVAFLMELLVASQPGAEVREALGALADLLVEAAQEWIKALSHAAHVDQPRGLGTQEDAGDFLTAIDALLALEHRTDDAERASTFAVVQNARDFRQLHICSRMADSLEEAADALKWAGLTAKDYLLGNVLRA